jgi:hypothetical protein
MSMSFPTKLVLAAALLATFSTAGANADRTTVCTITVNSPDEKEMFRRSLPADRYQFVELVERGRPDWLASACHKGIRCDVLLISGHFDGGDEFYSDRLDARESLPVDEMERVSCSDSCPGLFSALKEVYLFGCNTLNPDALKSASGELVRSFIRAGSSPDDAARLARVLGERHAESNRDRMREIFKDVPVIYGFSSKAPLGPKAASILERYFQSDAPAQVGSGRPNGKLLSLFAPSSMTVASGSTDADAEAAYRRDMCQFADDRLSPAQKLAFVHGLLGRNMAEVRMFLDRIEKYAASITDADRHTASVSQALDAIVGDRAARERYLAFARDADSPSVRARMIALAARLGWLTPSEKLAEIARMIQNEVDRNDIGAADVELVCTLNLDRSLDRMRGAIAIPAGGEHDIGRAAIAACLGSRAARARVVEALTSPRERDVGIAEVFLRHHPIVDVDELRGVAQRVALMSDANGQIRALDTLAQQGISDPESLESLTRLFPSAKTVNVQRAIAGILIRANYRVIAKPELVRALRERRLKSPDGQDVIDVLIRRMQASLGRAA